MRKFFFKLHLWASLTVSPLILVFAVTGCFMAFEPELDHLVHANLSYVEPVGKPLSLAAINDIVHKSYPHDTVTTYNLPASADISYQIYTNSQAIYIDQYSGKILGTMAQADFWNKAQNFIHQFHLRLAIQDKHNTGGIIMSWAAVILLLILPSGLVLWWKQKRTTIRKTSKGRQAWFDFHSMIGVFAFLFIMVPTVTGVIMGFENTTTPLLHKITRSKPSERPDFKII
ncbi:MAG TPA: PepSY-associated TM helix domain-containing protein, partial [Mucilaginibacter sp.]|nr:PepSY-associated TM helix domain-containing protein [Mucilaginibacter sp.]